MSEPVLRVVRGDATPEEVAALVTVLAAASGAVRAQAPAPMSVWADRSRAVRGRVDPGPDGWRASALPG